MKISTSLICALFGMSAFTAVAYNPSAEDRAKCFSDNADEQTVTFIFDNNLWKVSGITKLEVRGSFNSWKSNSNYAMTYDSDGDVWYVTVPYESVKIPGNSGQPEFKFVSNGSNYLSGGSKSFIPEGYIFLNGDKNNIVVFNDDDFETIKANSKTANVLKKVSDFDLTTEVGQQEISNFRLVPGTVEVFRSYHPYKFSKTSNATEPVRLQYVTELAVANNILADVCLSEDESSNLKSYTIGGTKYTETIPEYYQKIIDKGDVLYVGAGSTVPSYNAVYYNSDNEQFGLWVKEIVQFLGSGHVPSLIHCRLGTDRTGTFCAIIAAMCGATWQEIAADYQLTNRMGIQEFRDYHLLQYSLQKMLGVSDISQVENLHGAVTDYFVDNGYITEHEAYELRYWARGCVSVDDIAVQPSQISMRYDRVDNSISVDGGAVGNVEIYSISGARLSCLPIDFGRVSLTNLPAGLYVARLGTTAIKIAR